MLFKKRNVSEYEQLLQFWGPHPCMLEVEHGNFTRVDITIYQYIRKKRNFTGITKTGCHHKSHIILCFMNGQRLVFLFFKVYY